MRKYQSPNISINTVKKLAGAVRRPSPKPAFIDHQQTHRCTHCDKQTARRHWIYNMPCCEKCEKEHYRYITLTGAIQNYRLSPEDLALLNFVERENPHNHTWPTMRLYLLAEVEALAHQKILVRKQ